MVFILGKSLRDNKTVWAALTQFYGIGQTTSKQVCNSLLIHHQARISSLSTSKITLLTEKLSSMKIETELRRKVKKNIDTLFEIGCARGEKHALGVPVKGQRTRTNANTASKLNGGWMRHLIKQSTKEETKKSTQKK